MIEFKLSKDVGVKKFEIQIALDFDDEGNIKTQEYSNGLDWSDNPLDLRNCSSYCDELDQEEWDVFFNDFMFLLESDELLKQLSKLKKEGDSYFFDEENIEGILIGEDY